MTLKHKQNCPPDYKLILLLSCYWIGIGLLVDCQWIAGQAFGGSGRGGCGSGANENAFKAAFIKFARNNYSDHNMETRLKTSLDNNEPGSPDLSILSFQVVYE